MSSEINVYPVSSEFRYVYTRNAYSMHVNIVYFYSRGITKGVSTVKRNSILSVYML